MKSIGKPLVGLLLVVFVAAVAPAMGDELPLLILVDEQGRAVAEAAVVLENAEPLERIKRTSPAVMDQMHLQFVPQVLVIEVGTKVKFPNSDDTRHHVYSFSRPKSFELQLYRDNQAPPVKFDTPGLVVVGCNIHDAMRGYIYIVETPLHGLSNRNGEVSLPAFASRGDTRLTLWHPGMKQPMSLALAELAGDDNQPLEITLPFVLPEPAVKPEASRLLNRLQEFSNDDD